VKLLDLVGLGGRVVVDDAGVGVLVAAQLLFGSLEFGHMHFDFSFFFPLVDFDS